MDNLKSEVLFNRALMWVVLMHLTENKTAAMLFAVCGVLSLLRSAAAARPCLLRRTNER